MVTGSVSDDLRLHKLQLQRINIRDEDATAEISANINTCFITFEEVNTNVYDTFMTRNLEQIHNSLDENKTSCYKVIKKIEDKFQSKKSSKKSKANRSALAVWQDDEGENVARKNISNMIREWKAAVEGEIARIKLRLSLINQNGRHIYQEYLEKTKDMYHSVYKDIEVKYYNEIRSIDTACEIIARATELEVPIEPQLVLDVDEFSVRLDTLLYEQLPCLSPDPLPQTESSEDTFTIEQLSCIVDILKSLAPGSLMAERAFIYLLQDMIIDTNENNGPGLLPKLWHKMRPDHLNALSTHMFCRNEYIQWRDFILCNLPIPFPTEQDILDFRKASVAFDPDGTELMKEYQFFSIKTWFDNNIDSLLLLPLKKLLFKMYAVDEDTINYTALLLDFCKDVDPLLGFVKALELSIGKYICHDREMGNEYVSALYDQRLAQTEYAKRKKIEMKLDKMIIREIIKELIDVVVHQCDSVVIEDFHDSETPSLRTSNVDDLRVEFTNISNLEVISQRSSQQFVEITSELNPTEENKEDCHIEPEDTNEDDFLVYTLKIDPILCVTTTALPWHASVETTDGESFRQTIEVIYEECRNADFNVIFAFQFLHNKRLKEILSTTMKFTAVRSEQLIYKVLGKI